MSSPTDTHPAVLARLSSTITVEDGPCGYLQLVRETAIGLDQIITLRPEAEAKLLDFLLARRDTPKGQ